MDTGTNPEIYANGTLSDAMDRLEILVGRIGFNTAQQSRELLEGLDAVSTRLAGVTGASRKTSQVQFDSMLARLRKDAAQFVRDIGGAQALEDMRSQANPSREAEWWYLDRLITERRRSAARQAGFTLLGIVLALVLLVLVYDAFIAPPEEVTARYRLEQSARTSLSEQNLQAALDDINAALQYGPADPSLLVLQGVILEGMGRADEAQVSYTTAKAKLPREVEFLLERAQAYQNAGQSDKAMTDAQEAVRLEPQSAQGYLIIGSIHENNQRYRAALENFDLAFKAADAQGQTELAAIARTRTAMVMQAINMGATEPTDTPAP